MNENTPSELRKRQDALFLESMRLAKEAQEQLQKIASKPITGLQDVANVVEAVGRIAIHTSRQNDILFARIKGLEEGLKFT